MSMGETYKQLDKQPVAKDLLDLGQLTGEMRHINIETLHKLADVLNPVARAMSGLIKDSAEHISRLSSLNSDLKDQVRKMSDSLRESGRAMREEIGEARRTAEETIRKFQDLQSKTETRRIIETLLLTVTAMTAAMYFYMRFLN